MVIFWGPYVLKLHLVRWLFDCSTKSTSISNQGQPLISIWFMYIYSRESLILTLFPSKSSDHYVYMVWETHSLFTPKIPHFFFLFLVVVVVVDLKYLFSLSLLKFVVDHHVRLESIANRIPIYDWQYIYIYMIWIILFWSSLDSNTL